MLKERIITSTDINFIKTLIELNHEKILEIKYKGGIERISSIIDAAKAKGVYVSKSDTKDLRLSMTFYPEEIKNINFLEDLIFNKKNLFFFCLNYFPYIFFLNNETTNYDYIKKLHFYHPLMEKD